MTYEEMVQEISEAYAKRDASMIEEHVALEIDIRGEAEGAFYLELRHGKMIVAPYEYYDRDLLITTTAQVAIDIAYGRIGVEEAYRAGKLHARGDFDKGYILDEIGEYIE